jgi:DoxX-like family
MLIATDLLSGLLVFVFGGGAVGKVVRAKSQVQTAERLHIRWERYRLIGAPEAAAALGLLAGFAAAPLGAAAAIGLVLLMAGALSFRVRVHDAAAFLLGDGALLALAAATAVLRITSG